MRLSARRRPEVILLAALLALAVVAAITALRPPAPPVAVNLSAPLPMPRELGDPQLIAQLRERLRLNPDDADAYALLGVALLQRVRETGDPSLYGQAGQALDAAIARDPQHLDALIGQGSLALSRHQFQQALAWGERARAVAPRRAAVYGILGDAYNELGRYPEAVAAIQQMVNTRPDLHAYSRVAYLRELYGDVPGAIEMMALAVDAGAPGTESSLWARVQLGHLHFSRGDLAAAEEQYLLALAEREDYPYAQAGMARVWAAQGRHAQAARQYAAVIERLPLPEFVIALGELYESQGKTNEAQRQYGLVRAMQQLNADSGVDVDLELALFDADHGADPAAAVARARAAYERRPSIYAADALAWALHRAGEHAEALRLSQEALRLKTRDANLHFRAGMIALAAGDPAAARARLSEALAINPHFSPLRAPLAQRALEELP